MNYKISNVKKIKNNLGVSCIPKPGNSTPNSVSGKCGVVRVRLLALG